MKKIAYTMRISDEEIAMAEGFDQKGHFEPIEWPAGTDEQLQEARALLRAVQAHPFITQTSEGDYYVQEPARDKWVPEETDGEWLRRWREGTR